MKPVDRVVIAMVAGLLLLSAAAAVAQDWPQWRGINRDGKVAGFTAPLTWPAALTKKWQVTVGTGDASTRAGRRQTLRLRPARRQ